MNEWRFKCCLRMKSLSLQSSRRDSWRESPFTSYITSVKARHWSNTDLKELLSSVLRTKSQDILTRSGSKQPLWFVVIHSSVPVANYYASIDTISATVLTGLNAVKLDHMHKRLLHEGYKAIMWTNRRTQQSILYVLRDLREDRRIWACVMR